MPVTIIKRSRLPAYPPYSATAVTYLLLDKFHAAGWVWGVVGTVVILVWALVLMSIAVTEEKDPFPGIR